MLRMVLIGCLSLWVFLLKRKKEIFPREGWIAFKLRIFLSVFQDGKEF